MKNLFFNHIFVIESLPGGDRKTGKELYDDLLRYQEMKYPNLTVNYCPIISTADWNKLMDDIAQGCEQKGDQVILHLEIHGEKRGGGMVLANGEYLCYDEIRHQFVRINKASCCNLFLTMAVCKGIYAISSNRLNEPMPFCGILSSYDDIFVSDLSIRFNEFYDELFTSFDLTKAYIRLQKANPDLPSSYRIDHADWIFCRVYQNYINENCSPSVIKQRALVAANENDLMLSNRQQRRKFQRDFEEQEKKTREQYFKEAITNFFLLDEIPENKDRFEVPSNLKELKQRAEFLKQIYK